MLKEGFPLLGWVEVLILISYDVCLEGEGLFVSYEVVELLFMAVHYGVRLLVVLTI